MKELRTEIEIIDEKIIKLLKDRIKVSFKIGKFKKKNNLKVYDRKREQEILEKYTEKFKEIYRPEISKIFKTIFKLSRQIQSK